MPIKFVDRASPVGDFPVALAEDIDFIDGDSLQHKYDTGELGGGGANNIFTSFEDYFGADFYTEAPTFAQFFKDVYNKRIDDGTDSIPMFFYLPLRSFAINFTENGGWGYFSLAIYPKKNTDTSTFFEIQKIYYENFNYQSRMMVERGGFPTISYDENGKINNTLDFFWDKVITQKCFTSKLNLNYTSDPLSTNGLLNQYGLGHYIYTTYIPPSPNSGYIPRPTIAELFYSSEHKYGKNSIAPNKTFIGTFGDGADTENGIHSGISDLPQGCGSKGIIVYDVYRNLVYRVTIFDVENGKVFAGTFDRAAGTVAWDKNDGGITTLTRAEYDALIEDGTIDEEATYAVIDDPLIIDDSTVSEYSTWSSAKIAEDEGCWDRNSNGDYCVKGFDRTANNWSIFQARDNTNFDNDFVNGYILRVSPKEMFNRIKIVVHTPGVVRIGVVDEHVYDANPRYSGCLVKWLVKDFVAYTGTKCWDIEDTILGEGQRIFVENRVGQTGWYQNMTATAETVNGITYPANSCPTALNPADKLDTTTNNSTFKSQNETSCSVRFAFSNGNFIPARGENGAFDGRVYNATATTPPTDETGWYFGGLNVGFYRRTKYSDTSFCRIVENSITNSVGTNVICASQGQESLVGKTIYAVRMDITQKGNFTVYHLKGTAAENLKILRKHTLYARNTGYQTIHLPFDIKLGVDEFIGFGGFHDKSTVDTPTQSSAKWAYHACGNDLSAYAGGWCTTFDPKAMHFWRIGLQDGAYPEVFETMVQNFGYLNVELVCRGAKRSQLEDRYISITGDSISTFANFITTQAGYPEGNPAGNNAAFYPTNCGMINNIDTTWWGILARDNRMILLRNDAWSGSRCSGTGDSALAGSKRRFYLRNGYQRTLDTTYPFGKPEIVVNMIGTNDLSGNVEWGEMSYEGLAADQTKLLSAYSRMCAQFAQQENQATFVHFLIPRGTAFTYKNGSGKYLSELAAEFEKIAKAYGQHFIPLSYFGKLNPLMYQRWTRATNSILPNGGGTFATTADALHPNVMGMEAIAEAVERYLKEVVY